MIMTSAVARELTMIERIGLSVSPSVIPMEWAGLVRMDHETGYLAVTRFGHEALERFERENGGINADHS